MVRLRPLAEGYRDQWAAAVGEGKGTPPCFPVDVLRSEAASTAGKSGVWAKAEPRHFSQRVVDFGFRLDTFMALQNYVDRCREGGKCPRPNEVLRALLPKAATCGLIPRSSGPVLQRCAVRLAPSLFTSQLAYVGELGNRPPGVRGRGLPGLLVSQATVPRLCLARH